MIEFWGIVLLTKKDYDTLDKRITSVEHQYVVERDPQSNNVIKTLADIPVDDRNGIAQARERRAKSPMAGKPWNQRRRWLEATDGGRKVERKAPN